MSARLPRVGSIGDGASATLRTQGSQGRVPDLPAHGWSWELEDIDRIEMLLEGSPAIGSAATVGRARAEGHLAEARGDLEKAVEYFLEAVAVAEDFGRTTDATLARIDTARVLSDDRLGPTIAAAREQAERMGADRLIAQLDEIEGIAASEAAGA